MRFLVISLTVNAALTQGQALRPSTPSDARSLEYTEAQHLERAIPAIDVASSSDVTLGEAVVEGREEMTGLAVRQSDTTALSVRQNRVERLQHLTGHFGLAAKPYAVVGLGIGMWNMVPACQSFTKDKGTNAVNCVWGVFSTIVTFSAAALYTSIWTGTLVNMWLNGKRDINFQRSLDEFSNITGHSISYHGLWDHAKLGLNYSEVSMENEDPLHVFGLVAPDGSQTHLAYIGNSTGQHKFRLGFGDPSMMPRDSSTSNSKRDPTMNDQYFSFGGIEFMVDPNFTDGGYLDIDAEDWNEVYSQVSCLWGSDATSDLWLSQGAYYQMYDFVNEGTVTGGAMSMFLGSYQSILPQMSNIPTPLTLGTCGKVYS